MLRDSLIASTLANVSIGDKICQIKKLPIWESHPATGAVGDVFGPDKLLAKLSNAMDVGQHASRVERHGRAGVIGIGAHRSADSHELFARQREVGKASFHFRKRGNDDSVERRQCSSPLRFFTSYDVAFLKGK